MTLQIFLAKRFCFTKLRQDMLLIKHLFKLEMLFNKHLSVTKSLNLTWTSNRCMKKATPSCKNETNKYLNLVAQNYFFCYLVRKFSPEKLVVWHQPPNEGWGKPNIFKPPPILNTFMNLFRETQQDLELNNVYKFCSLNSKNKINISKVLIN
jgi:hypothetical protein